MHTSNDLLFLLTFVGIPAVLCGGIGALHGWRGASRVKALLGALVVSGITCWSVVVGGGGDMPLPGLLPSWFVSPFGPFAGPLEDILPPWWLTPWLPFLVYFMVARYALRVRQRRARSQHIAGAA